ncbi:MAG: flagellar brake protein [Thiobacillaceae bacterium]
MADQSDQNQESEGAENSHWGQYAIHGWREVLFYLRGILEQKLLVNISLLGSREFIISSILDIGEESGEMVMDSVVDHPFNRRASAGSDIHVETSLDHIKIVFDTTISTLADFEGRPAIHVHIPDSIIRLQRREHFRVTLPIVKPVQCVIPAAAAGNPDPVSTMVLDISLGGVAISDNKGTFSPRAGDTLTQCEIALPEVGTLCVNLRVHSVAQITARTGIKKKRIGCSFVDLPYSMVSTLQRYIMKLERERRSKL